MPRKPNAKRPTAAKTVEKKERPRKRRFHDCRKCGSTELRKPEFRRGYTHDPLTGIRLYHESYLAWPCARCGHCLTTPTLDSHNPLPAQQMIDEMEHRIEMKKLFREAGPP